MGKKVDTSEVKRILKSVWFLEDKLEADREAVLRLRSMLTRITPVLSLTPGGTNMGGDKMTEPIAKIADLEAKIANNYLKYQRQIAVVQKLIRTLEDKRMQAILIRRYLNREPWEKIARELNFSRAHMLRLHSKALILLAGGKS